MQNLTFFDYQNNKYGQNTLKTPKNIALHMKRKQTKPNESKTKANENVSQDIPQTFRKHSAKDFGRFVKRVANISQSFQKIMQKIITPRHKMIYFIYKYMHIQLQREHDGTTD